MPSLQSYLLLHKLKQGMTEYEVAKVFGNSGQNIGSGRLILEYTLPDGRLVNLGFDMERTLEEVWIKESDDEWVEYFSGEQAFIMPFKPDSLQGVQYGMTPKEIETIFLKDYTKNTVSFDGWGEVDRAIAVASNVIYAEPDTYPSSDIENIPDIRAYIIILSTEDLVIMGFEAMGVLYKPEGLLYVHMQATNGQWYVYNLNTQKMTGEQVINWKYLKVYEWLLEYVNDLTN